MKHIVLDSKRDASVENFVIAFPSVPSSKDFISNVCRRSSVGKPLTSASWNSLLKVLTPNVYKKKNNKRKRKSYLK